MPDHRHGARTLAEQVRWQLLWLGTGLFFVCLLILLVFAWRSAVLNTNSLMQLDAQSLIRQAAEHPDLPLPHGETFSAYRQWEEIPESLRSHFGSLPVISGKVMEVSIANADGTMDYLYLLHHIDANYGELFLLSRHRAAEIETVSLAFFNTALNQAFWLTVIIFISLFFMVGWLIRRTTAPLALLSQWASNLGKNPDQPLSANFPIEELNQLAAQLHEGVGRIQAFNQREQQFLKHASHELRTPLAIIQASLDTLNLQSSEASRPAVQRALKASANMRRLSAALLWLARECERPVDKSYIAVHDLCEQIINDHRYLLNNRQIDICSDISVDTLYIESDLFSIVIANLVRNAFMYSVNGVIELDVSTHALRITNPIQAEASSEKYNDSPGFGLGLQLVKRICAKLDWQFSFNIEKNSVIVAVTWRYAG
ncbi:MAG: HAMP domain-containing histidine kinase [Gammaproteobacteria bacterium]|nr:HAMP domain-containing histidine kinase [Gammaproteobacteria bacterium]